MASTYQTTRGYGVDYRDEYGTRHRLHVGSEAAAQAYAQRVVEQVHQVRAAILHQRQQPQLSLTEAVQLYLASRAMLPSTRSNEQWLSKRLERYCASVPIADVTPQLLHAYLEVRRDEISPANLQREMRWIKRLFRHLTSNWYIHADPSTGIDPTGVKVPRSAGLPLTYEQEQLILVHATHASRLRCLFALDAGLRASEIKGLRLNHLNLDEQIITVWAPKTRNWRTLPLSARLLRELVPLVAHCEDPDAPLCGHGGRHVRNATSWIRLLRLRVGYHFRFHDLRHTFATRIAAVATNPHVVRVALGHAARSNTDLYVHPSIAEIREAIQRMAALNPNANPNAERRIDGTEPA